jgi:uncharacterized linocin/CFP29 family protein
MDMDILKRELAPITLEAWAEIDAQATRSLTATLSARKVLDVTGPMGPDFAGVPEGRLDFPKKKAKDDVAYGIYRVHHLVEAKVPFDLEIAELDNVVRGAKDVDLTSLEHAARNIALFEEKVVYHGLTQANINGLNRCAENKCLTMGSQPEQLLEGIAEGITIFTERSIEGPFAFVAGPKIWSKMSAHLQGYPVKMQAENILGGSVLLSPYLSGEYENEAYLISQRGGDFEIVLGQDLSVGYEKHSDKAVTLYFTESFTFRILEPAAAICYTTV